MHDIASFWAPEPRDWSPGTGAIDTTCEHCGNQAPCILAVNPYDADVFNLANGPKTYWCKPCYSACADDI